MSKENPNEFKIINKNERLKYRQIINQLKQQLEEKGKEINIKNNKLAELKKELTICKDKLKRKTQSNRDLQHRVHNVNTQLAEKDKEIEEKMMSFEKRCQEYYKSDEFKRDFAIQELEKVKNKCNGMYELWLDSNYKENMYNNEDIAGVFEDISVFTNDLIKKLKGE